MPYEVLDTLDQVTREWAGGLLDVYAPTMFTDYRATIGRALGADQDEIVICHNATEGIARVINGLDLHEGDEVVTTTHECYSVLSNFNLLRNRFGIKIKAVTPPTGYDVRAEDIVELVEAAVTPRTKVLAFAAITLFTGTAMPIRMLCDVAQRHGLITVVDGALLPGVLNRNLRSLGVDFMACSGSKFQCGPLGTGILYVRNKVNPEYNRLPLPVFWPIISTWYPMQGSPPPRTRTRVESDNIGDYLQSAGSANLARGAGLARASELWDEIGRDRIEARTMELADFARERLSQTFGEERIYSPSSDFRLRSPLVAFNPFRPSDAWNVKKFAALTARLADEYRVWIRWTEFNVPNSPHQHYAARFSGHIYNTDEEIDHAVRLIARIASAESGS